MPTTTAFGALCEACGLICSFSVARPASTRMKLMIQKRTMTFGSAQPLSS